MTRTCVTCYRPVDQPFRVYDNRGKVTHGCVDASHDGHLIPGTESSRWHHRPEAEAIRREARKCWGKGVTR